MLSKIKLRISMRRHRIVLIVALVLLCSVIVGGVQPADAAKFVSRGMYVNSARASDTTYYIISFQYPTTNTVGSLRLQFCDNPIPDLPCISPPGLDVSNGTLAAQTGETGFSIAQQSTNEIILSRTPSATGLTLSSYRFDNMHNPDGTPAGWPALSDENTNFYVRITDYASNDASGSFIDYGSVTSTITPELMFITQVPPILIFCAAGTINDDECTDTSGDFVNFGELDSSQTSYTKSEFLARTNAAYGYSVYLSGKTFTSGIRAIPALTTPTSSFVGVGQFGINLATNSNPSIGAPPTGPGTNAIPNPVYNNPDQFLFNDGDVLVSSNGVTPTRKFTASYILNVPADQHPGVYSTTITYICLAGF